MPAYEKSITLPSRGLFYNNEIPGGVLQLRPMSTQDEKVLATPGQSGTRSLDNLMKRCASLPEKFNPSDLLTADRMSLLVHLRVLSYGPAYTVYWVCDSCRGRTMHEMDLDAEVLSSEVLLEDGEDPTFDVHLMSGKALTMRRPTGKDEEEAAKYRQRVKGNYTDVDEYIRARIITAIDGVSMASIKDALDFIRMLPVRDGIAMRDALRDKAFGIDRLEFEFTCNLCSMVSAPMSLPISDDFFRLVSPHSK